MFSTPSLLRLEEHRALSRIALSGRVLDLGGDKNSEYLRFFSGSFTTTTVNFDEKTRPDVRHDLETPLPFADRSYDHVLLINVLVHLFEYRMVLREAVRVLAPGGSIIIATPFLYPVHPSPEDYRRFTASALRKEFAMLGMGDIAIETLGSGVWSVRYALLDRLLPKPFRFLRFYTVRYCAYALDALMDFLARKSRKKYQRTDYALGLLVVAHKP